MGYHIPRRNNSLLFYEARTLQEHSCKNVKYFTRLYYPFCITPNEELCITGSTDGEIKSGSFTSTHDPHVFTEGHKSTKFFSNLPGGSVKGYYSYLEIIIEV